MFLYFISVLISPSATASVREQRREYEEYAEEDGRTRCSTQKGRVGQKHIRGGSRKTHDLCTGKLYSIVIIIIIIIIIIINLFLSTKIPRSSVDNSYIELDS